MKIITSVLDIPGPFGLTIGNFDGVHKGHAHLIDNLIQKCGQNNLKTAIMTFHPHPATIIGKNKDEQNKGFLLCDRFQKIDFIKSLGIDYFLEIEFNRDFSLLSAESFLNNQILCSPHIKLLLLGHDFAFGLNKSGGHQLTKTICGDHLKVEESTVFNMQGHPVNSTRIRGLIKDGSIHSVESLLGRPYSMNGRVIKGDGRGRKIGFPTANIEPSDDYQFPKQGVYITQTLWQGMTYQSLTNVGKNPTFKDQDYLQIETHLLDFSQDIYGENIQVQFLKILRDEIKFSNVNQLVDQINQDKISCFKYFDQEKNNKP